MPASFTLRLPHHVQQPRYRTALRTTRFVRIIRESPPEGYSHIQFVSYNLSASGVWWRKNARPSTKSRFGSFFFSSLAVKLAISIRRNGEMACRNSIDAVTERTRGRVAVKSQSPSTRITQHPRNSNLMYLHNDLVRKILGVDDRLSFDLEVCLFLLLQKGSVRGSSGRSDAC